MEESPFIQDIRQEGQRLEARRVVLDILRIRFGDAAAQECEATANRLESLEQLRELSKSALQSRRFSQFRKGLSQG